MINDGIIATTAAELMDILDSEHEYSETAKIAEVIVIVRVEDTKDGDTYSFTQWRSSTNVRTHQLGLLMHALNGLNQNLGR